MADEKTLKEALVSAFEQLKAQSALLSAVICDVAALRSTLLRDPETLVRYEEALVREVENAKAEIAASALIFDEIIRLLRGPVGWTN